MIEVGDEEWLWVCKVKVEDVCGWCGGCFGVSEWLWCFVSVLGVFCGWWWVGLLCFVFGGVFVVFFCCCWIWRFWVKFMIVILVVLGWNFDWLRVKLMLFMKLLMVLLLFLCCVEECDFVFVIRFKLFNIFVVLIIWIFMFFFLLLLILIGCFLRGIKFLLLEGLLMLIVLLI